MSSDLPLWKPQSLKRAGTLELRQRALETLASESREDVARLYTETEAEWGWNKPRTRYVGEAELLAAVEAGDEALASKLEEASSTAFALWTYVLR